MGLILDTSLLVADEREDFNLVTWLRSRPPEPVAVSAITFSELWFGLEAEEDKARAGRRRRWLEKTFRRLEVVPLDTRVARIQPAFGANCPRRARWLVLTISSSPPPPSVAAGRWRHSTPANSTKCRV